MLVLKKYPANWESMREAMFQAYGGKHCTEGIFKNLGYKAKVPKLFETVEL